MTRLIDMGIPPFLLGSSLRLVMAQRLARKVCEDCREPYEADEDDLIQHGLAAQGRGRVTLYRGRGCQLCNLTGLKGRIALYEVMPITREIRELIVARGHVVDNARAAVVRLYGRTVRFRLQLLHVPAMHGDGARPGKFVRAQSPLSGSATRAAARATCAQTLTSRRTFAHDNA